jgi:hypothetical protein
MADEQLLSAILKPTEVAHVTLKHPPHALAEIRNCHNQQLFWCMNGKNAGPQAPGIAS